MVKKRLIITSVISIILVSILFIGSTYSIYTTTSPNEEINKYQTGSLQIEVIGDDETIESIIPTSVNNADKLTPYRVTVKNNGTVPYQFNVLLEETTSSNGIDHQYIFAKVGKLDAITLKDCNNILKKDIIVMPMDSVDIDVRVWVSDGIPNTEINKSFFAKIKIDGQAISSGNYNIDNSNLVNS